MISIVSARAALAAVLDSLDPTAREKFEQHFDTELRAASTDEGRLSALVVEATVWAQTGACSLRDATSEAEEAEDSMKSLVTGWVESETWQGSGRDITFDVSVTALSNQHGNGCRLQLGLQQFATILADWVEGFVQRWDDSGVGAVIVMDNNPELLEAAVLDLRADGWDITAVGDRFGEAETQLPTPDGAIDAKPLREAKPPCSNCTLMGIECLS